MSYRHTLLPITLLLAAIVPNTAADVGRWSSAGPEGGFIASLAVDPSNPATLYAGTLEDRLFKTTDGGQSWHRADTGLSGRSHWVGAVAIDPSRPDTVYAGTLRGVLKSVDGGDSWQPTDTSLNRYVRALAIDPANPDTLFAGITGGIYRTTDGGTTWEEVTAAEEVGALAVDPSATGTVYAAARSDGVLKSVDGGDTWTPSNGGLGDARASTLVLAPQDPSTLYATTSAGLFVSRDGGGLWSLLVERFFAAVAVSPVDPEILWATTSGSSGSVWLSGDGGATWEVLSTSPYDLNIRLLQPDPLDADGLHVGALQGMWRSADGGATWQPRNHGLVATRTRAVAVAPSDPSLIYAGTDNSGAFKSIDGGRSWTPTSAGIDPFYSIHDIEIDPVEPATVYLATLRGVYKSTDAGQTWQRYVNALETTFIEALEIDPGNPATLYAATDRDGVWRSVDAGVSWTAASAGLTNLIMESLAIDPHDPQTLYAGSNTGGLFKSVDGGDNWNPTGSSLTATFINVLEVDPGDSSVVYAGSAISNDLFRSADGGATWARVAGGLQGVDMRGLAIDPADSSRVYAATLSQGVYRSLDGGSTWEQLTGAGLENVDIATLALAPGAPTLHAGSFGAGVVSLTEDTTCVADAATLCLGDGRFRAEVSWRDFRGNVGIGLANALTDETGTFWFFDQENIEIVLKVLDGRPINDHFWVFFASLSNVAFTLTVTDTETGLVRTYDNPEGAFASRGDILAFPAPSDGGAPGGTLELMQPQGMVAGGTTTSLPGGGSCEPSATELCLADGRFRVTAQWQDFVGNAGVGRPLELTADTGAFWFFDDDNIELVIKVLDGRGLNDHFWVFFASLSNVGFSVTITDTVTGNSRTYDNPPGRFASFGDILALPGT